MNRGGDVKKENMLFMNRTPGAGDTYQGGRPRHDDGAMQNVKTSADAGKILAQSPEA